jgi:hypothetical protein
MRKIILSDKDCHYLFWLLKQEAYNQKDDKKEILQIANKFKV